VDNLDDDEVIVNDMYSSYKVLGVQFDLDNICVFSCLTLTMIDYNTH
jgi:hypothetical protein